MSLFYYWLADEPVDPNAPLDSLHGYNISPDVFHEVLYPNAVDIGQFDDYFAAAAVCVTKGLVTQAQVAQVKANTEAAKAAILAFQARHPKVKQDT